MSKYLLGERVHEWALLNRAHVCPILLVVDCVDQGVHTVNVTHDAQHMKLHWPHIDTVLVLSGMEYVNREQLNQRRYQTCRRQATNETTESYADMTVYAMCQARLELTMCPPQTSYNYCHLKLTNVQQLWYFILFLVAKIHTCSLFMLTPQCPAFT